MLRQNAFGRRIARAFVGRVPTPYSGDVRRTTKSWVPIQEELLQKVTTNSLIHEMSVQATESAATVVPWFLSSMPASYFNQIPETLRKQHLKAVLAIRDLKQLNLSLKLESKGEDGSTEITFINSQTETGMLHSQIKNLSVPAGSHLNRVRVFSSLDNQLALNVFSFDNTTSTKQSATRADGPHIMEYINEIKAGKHLHDSRIPKYSNLFSDESMDDYFSRVSPSYLQSGGPRRFLIQRELFEAVRGTDGTAVHIETYLHANSGSLSAAETAAASAQSQAWITIAAANVLPEVLLRLSSSIIAARNFNISRAHMETVSDHESSSPEMPSYVTMLRLLVSPDPLATDAFFTSKEMEQNISLTGTEMEKKQAAARALSVKVLKRDLKRAKWLDDSTTDLGLIRFPWVGVEKAEIITALCSMLHGPLAKVDRHAFTSISEIIDHICMDPMSMQYADQIAQLFLDRFRPDGTAISTEEFQKVEAEIRGKVSRLNYEFSRTILLKMLDATAATLKTNFFNEDRYALSLRVNPSIMMSGPATLSKPVPFGIFFCHGRHFNAFHCRFRDIARGGLRLVTPPNSDKYALESSRHFDEAYGLSFAQHLKNKDIPEGGSKAVLLVNTPAMPTAARFFAMRKSVKGFTDSLLDLIVSDSLKNVVDLYGKDELIYLGPDEQVIASDIDYITLRAAQRGYPIPSAFMSSKKDAGFNHKEYGVTSEGVMVYLDVALSKALKINPLKGPFTIKITGGPDGDVAGNLIKLLYRDYGDNCRIVGIADGFGVAEDPKGLDRTELLRLVAESRPVTSFNKSKLSPTGVMMDAETEEGLARRNSMAFRVKSDVFVPAGGRPNTINGDNWEDFLDSKGVPSSPLIVEGANIFITPEARENLFKQAGVTIVKDSSANKCGVITSSCEVAASMLLSKEEFMGIKEELVKDVLVRLRLLALLEAEVLFREYRQNPGGLHHFSEQISFAIVRVTDALTDYLADREPEDSVFSSLLPLMRDNLPKKLAEVAWDRVATKFPVQYQRNAVASTLASTIVYQEGIHFVQSKTSEELALFAIRYYNQDEKIRKLVREMETPGGFEEMTEDRKMLVVELLRKGGARTSMEFH